MIGTINVVLILNHKLEIRIVSPFLACLSARVCAQATGTYFGGLSQENE